MFFDCRKFLFAILLQSQLMAGRLSISLSIFALNFSAIVIRENIFLIIECM